MDPITIALKIGGWLKKVAGRLIKSKDQNINKEVTHNQELGKNLQDTGIGHMEIGGDFYYFDMRGMPRKFINKFVERLDNPGSPQQDFRLMESEFSRTTVEYEEKFNVTENELLERAMPHLDPTSKSILNLAIGAEYHYKRGEVEKAEKIKEEIKEFYGKLGNVLCNLYTSGYIDKVLNYVQDVEKNMSDKELGEIVNAHIEELLTRTAKYIHFVYEMDEIDDLVINATNDMSDGAEYIAFHGAGRNASKVVSLVAILQDRKVVKENYQLSWTVPVRSTHAIFFVAILRIKTQ